MIYCQFSTVTRALLGVAPSPDAFAPSPTAAVVVLPEWEEAPPAPWAWRPDLLNFALPARPLLTQQEFMDRWEVSGAGAVMDLLFSLQAKDTTDGAFARKALMRFQTARGIDPADPRTVALTDVLLVMGVSLGLFSAEVKTSARAIVLAPL